jgi:hypothetical protein
LNTGADSHGCKRHKEISQQLANLFLRLSGQYIGLLLTSQLTISRLHLSILARRTTMGKRTRSKQYCKIHHPGPLLIFVPLLFHLLLSKILYKPCIISSENTVPSSCRVFHSKLSNSISSSLCRPRFSVVTRPNFHHIALLNTFPFLRDFSTQHLLPVRFFLLSHCLPVPTFVFPFSVDPSKLDIAFKLTKEDEELLSPLSQTDIASSDGGL